VPEAFDFDAPEFEFTFPDGITPGKPAGKACGESLRGKHLNSLERVECKEVQVPSDNVAGMAAHGKLQELVVLRIAALIKTFVSKTQRNYTPLRRESKISGVSPRAFALFPASLRIC
jgi:hypothetical protein